MSRIVLFIVTALSTIPTSSAGIYGGNPQLSVDFDPGSGITVDRALVHLKSVVFWGCGNPINEAIIEAPVDFSVGWSVDLPADDFCQVTLNYNSDLFSEGFDQNDAFRLASQTRQMHLILPAGQTATIDLADSFVLSGIYGGNPQLQVTRDP